VVGGGEAPSAFVFVFPSHTFAFHEEGRKTLICRSIDSLVFDDQTVVHAPHPHATHTPQRWLSHFHCRALRGSVEQAGSVAADSFVELPTKCVQGLGAGVGLLWCVSRQRARAEQGSGDALMQLRLTVAVLWLLCLPRVLSPRASCDLFRLL